MCYCGNIKPDPGKRQDEHQCIMPCAGDSNLKCGHNSLQSLYQISELGPSSGIQLDRVVPSHAGM